MTDHQLAQEILLDEKVKTNRQEYMKKKQNKKRLFATIELIAYFCFATASVTHTFIDHTLHKLYQAQRSVNQ
jgi:hypothetical protein